MRISRTSFHTALKGAGYRATPGRLEILELLKSAEGPLSIRDVKKKLSIRLDQVTVYRILHALARAGLVRRVDLQHRHAHYELADAADHHHLICVSCGAIEDFEGCDFEDIVKHALGHSKKFSEITQHSLELFGLCKTCAQK